MYPPSFLRVAARAAVLSTLFASIGGCVGFGDSDATCMDVVACGSDGLAFRECVTGDRFRFNDGSVFSSEDDARRYCEAECGPDELCGISCSDSPLPCEIGRAQQTCRAKWSVESFERFEDGTEIEDRGLAGAYCEGCNFVPWTCVDGVSILECPDGSFEGPDSSLGTDDEIEAELWCEGYDYCLVDQTCPGSELVYHHCLMPDSTYFRPDGSVIGDSRDWAEYCIGGQP